MTIEEKKQFCEDQLAYFDSFTKQVNDLKISVAWLHTAEIDKLSEKEKKTIDSAIDACHESMRVISSNLNGHNNELATILNAITHGKDTL